MLKLDRKLFHSGDLAVLWGISNKNTLYTTIKRYVQKGVLIPVYKGLYSVIPISKIDPYALGVSVIHGFTYLSTETVLANNGIIFQTIYPYTFIAGLSKKTRIKDYIFLFRRMKPEYLHNMAGISNQNGVLIASPERAVADMLYFNKKYHFDSSDKIDWKRVRAIQKEVDYG